MSASSCARLATTADNDLYLLMERSGIRTWEKRDRETEKGDRERTSDSRSIVEARALRQRRSYDYLPVLINWLYAMQHEKRKEVQSVELSRELTGRNRRRFGCESATLVFGRRSR